MPTPEAPEANASISPSLTVALRNANITELAVEEADFFKANVSTSTMTQDQCLDNGHHQANSNNRFSSDKVSDDLNNSKNSVVSNGVNSVQEFNVVVNREYSTDLVIVQDRNVDAKSSPTKEVLPTTSKRSTETPTPTLVQTPSNLVSSNRNILNNLIGNIDADKSEIPNNNTGPDMTVITHQNSSENIRDIIANSDKANKNSSDAQLDSGREGQKENSDINSNRSSGTRRVRKLIRSENVRDCEIDQIEDPIERLNKLRASISSALSEVKGVLKQYSTEQSCDEPNESASSKQPSDDGPVRFRFVRKIRRRSVFSEDDETAIPITTSDVTATPIIENKVIESVQSEFQDSEKILIEKNKDETVVVPKLEDDENPHETNTDESYNQSIQKAAPEITEVVRVSKDEKDRNVSGNQQMSKVDPSEAKTEKSEALKTKIGKIKKVLKKDRRASIAAVEASQISGDEPPIPIDLKTQRRPSDSGTLVKQTTRVKAKTGEKTKLVSSRKAKASPSTKTESSTSKPSQIVKDVEKASSTLITEEKSSCSSSAITDSNTRLETHGPDAVVIENLTKPTIPSVSSASIQNNSSSINLESSIIKKTDVPIKADAIPSPSTIAEVNVPQETNLTTLTSSEALPGATVTASADTNVSTGKFELTKVKATAVVSIPTSTPPNISEAATIVTSSPTKISEAGTSVSLKVKDGLSQSISEPIITPLKANTVQPPIHTQQSLKPKTDTIVENPNQQIATSKQNNQYSKPTAPAEKVKSGKDLQNSMEVLENKTATPHLIKTNEQTKMIAEVKQKEFSKTAILKESKTISTVEKVDLHKKSNADECKPMQNNSISLTPKNTTESVLQKDLKNSDSQQINTDDSLNAEADVPIPSNVPKDAVAVKLNLPGQQSVEELQRLEEQQEKETSPPDATETTETTETPEKAATAAAPPKKKRKAKRKVVIRRIKRKLSKDDTFLHQKEVPAELEICEKEIEEKDLDEEPEEEVCQGPKEPKSCLKKRQFEIGDVVMYAEHYKKTQVRWKKAVVTERITSISYKLNIEGEERPAHISYIKKFTDRKVNFGGKEYLEIDYAQIEENEEKERNYSIWNLV